MLNLVATVFGIGAVVAMTAIAAGLVYVGLNEESHAHEAARAEAAD